MSDSDEPLRFVYQLPAKIVCELSNILDPGNTWERMAFIMPGIQDIDIEACRKLSMLGNHPTECLLRIWGSKGYTILDLYKILYQSKLLRCMNILLPFVDSQLHSFASADTEDSLHQSPQKHSQHNLHNNTPRSPVLRQSSNLTNKSIAAAVYSRKGSNFISAEPSAVGARVAASGPVEVTPASTASASTDHTGSLISGLQNTPSVKHEDLAAATGGFSTNNIIGRGGYGVVYKGNWKHTEVAIKRIQGKREGGGDERQQKERFRQSLQELRTLAKYRHDNVLSLYGYSLDGPEPCLIYQFMLNGSLEDRLLCRNGTKPLNWLIRLSICKGVSCGLHFLHTISQMPIIHADVKSANILLDKHFEPKLGDFGLSRDGQIELGSNDKKPMIASHVKGTLAYLPPEFLMSRILTTKLDVYSFGVVLLEVATGQRAFSSSRDPQGIVEYVIKMCPVLKQNQLTMRNEFEKLADKRIPEDEGEMIFGRLLSIGIDCTRKDRFARPIFSEVFARLNESWDEKT